MKTRKILKKNHKMTINFPLKVAVDGEPLGWKATRRPERTGESDGLVDETSKQHIVKAKERTN